MRIEYEVSTNLFANTNPTAFDPSTFDLTAYPAAYRHVRSLIASQVSNIEFIYHAVRGEAPTLYPGDAVVDYIGFSMFNNDVCLPVGTLFNCEGELVDPNLLSDIKWAPKPKLVAESAVQPPSSSADDGDAFIEYLDRVRDVVVGNGFVGWTYINSDWTAHGWSGDSWGDSRIEVVPEVEAWFVENVVDDERFVFG